MVNNSNTTFILCLSKSKKGDKTMEVNWIMLKDKLPEDGTYNLGYINLSVFRGKS